MSTHSDYRLTVGENRVLFLDTTQPYHSILTHWNTAKKFQCWASLKGMTVLGMTISQPLLKLQRANLVSYLRLYAILLPVNFLDCIGLKFVLVSNMALICGERPPSILLLHWMQSRSKQLN